MHLERTLRKPGFQRHPDGLRFLLGSAMHQSVICIPTPGDVWIVFRHPDIKRVVEE
jgi:hypothetical protein